MKRKRILYVEGNVDGTVGGSYIVLYDLIVNLDKNKYCPVALFYNDNFIAEKLRRLGIETHIMERPASFVYALKNNNSKAAHYLYQLLRPSQRIINIFKRLLFPALRQRKFLKEWEINLVNLNNSITRNHEWMVAAMLAGVDCMTHEMGINRSFDLLSRFFASRMKAIITVSNQVKNNMEKHGLNHPHIMTIHNGIDLKRYQIQRSPEELRRQLNLPQDAPIIGVLGNIKYWKGQETVVRALPDIKKEFPDIRCLLVGAVANGDREYYENLKKLIDQLDIYENVICTGFQENGIDYMNLMDVVIHPSVDPEPFGIINLEAMYLKKPVISTTIGAPPEIFENRISGILIDPGKPDLLATECLFLLRAPETAAKIGNEGYERLMNNFTIDINVRKTEAVYSRLFSLNSGHQTMESAHTN